MFDKNDKVLYRARIIIMAFCIVLGVGGMICGIVFMASSSQNPEYLGLGIVYLIGSPLLSILAWVFEELIFTVIVDIKLIRNKMYDIDNEKLLNWGDINSPKPVDTQSYSYENDKMRLLHECKMLLDSGAITEEEFDEQKKIILEK